MTGLLKAGYRDGDTIDFGPYKIRLTVNPRARGLKVRIDRMGQVVATASRPGRLEDAVSFAKTQHDWIVRKLNDCVKPDRFAPGMELTIAGLPVTLAEKPGVISARLVDGQLLTSGDEATFARRIERYLRQQALKALQMETDRYAAKLGFSGVKVALFDAKARWGSCTPARKSIRYSWRIILAPPSVLSYLCAHEVAHLRHPDHSPRFWAEVTSLFGGDYKPARNWLKTAGQELFKYQ
ncbi:MAG: M48 family metallopeptidase [Asticcacaulis sp.]|nr:M48 family metallopeptidase [Asticcacaulis sp.]